jgi:hypothetical protein
MTASRSSRPVGPATLRQRVTKGAGSRTKGLLMAYKLLDMAQARWRRLDGADLLPLVRAGITFVDGVQQVTNGPPAKRAGRLNRLSESGGARRPLSEMAQEAD